MGIKVKRTLYEGVAVPILVHGAEYGSSREEEIKYNGDEVSEKYV